MSGLTLTPFASDRYNLVNMVKSVNRKAVVFSTLQALNLFKYEGINTTTFFVERLNGQVTVVPSTAFGAPGVVLENDKRDERPFSVSHVQVDSSIMPSEISGIREFGTTATPRTCQSLPACAPFSRSPRTLRHYRLSAVS